MSATNDEPVPLHEEDGTPPPAGPVTGGAGAALLAERRAQGLSLGDIARQLKLSVRQVEALEHDDYSAFPGPLFVRGFLRNYARLLHLDAEAILRAANLASAPAAQVAQTQNGSMVPRPATSERGRKVLVTLTLVVLAVVAAILVASNAARDQRSPSSVPSGLTDMPPAAPTQPASPPPAEHAAAEPSVPASAPSTAATPSAASESKAAAAPSDAASAAPKAAAKSEAAATGEPKSATKSEAQSPDQKASTKTARAESDAAPTKKSAAAAVPAASATASQPTADSAAPAAGNTAQIKMSFDDESWVEIRDASGETIYSRLNTPGTERTVKGIPPFIVVVGNAHGVRLVYKDKAVDLAPHTRVDVARVTLE